MAKTTANQTHRTQTANNRINRAKAAWILGLACLLPALAAGCAEYAVPGPAAQLSEIGDYSVQREFDRRPVVTFPTALAVAHIQGPGYGERHYYRGSNGNSKFTVISVRETENEAAVKNIRNLQKVTGVIFLNDLLLPTTVKGEEDLRTAAARVQAKLLMLYTFNTKFEVDDKLAPLTTISLGLFPTKDARLVCTASAVIVDTQTGYLYAAAEATARRTQTANAWTSDQAVDESRRLVESEAFGKLASQLPQAWTRILELHDKPTGTATPAPKAAQ